MKIPKILNHIFISGLLLMAPPLQLFSQDTQNIIEIDPLFEYPVAPEELEGITAKSNYLIDHFWDPMDFKTKAAVDQNALNDAMNVYTAPLRWADKAKADAAVDRLIDKISKNPTLLVQFTKAAEETMYSPRAEVWIDGIYVKFLNAFLKNKKMSEVRKKYYQKQQTTLTNTLVGQTAPTFTFTGRDNKTETYMPMSTPTMIIFGNPGNPDWRLARLKLETNVQLTQAIDQGKLNILYIIPYEDPNWESAVANYPAKWTTGIAPTIGDQLDLRVSPAIYIVGSDGKIIAKNITLDNALRSVFEQIGKP